MIRRLCNTRTLPRLAHGVALLSFAGGNPAPDSTRDNGRAVSHSLEQAAGDSVTTEWLKIRSNSGTVLAAVARPKGNGPFPAVVILHGTHGFAEEYVRLARDLAGNGFLSLAACWFEGGRGAGRRFITPIACPGAPPFVDAEGTERFRIARGAITAIISAVRERADVQRDRIALVGHSRGAGAALDYVLQRTGGVSAVVLNSAGYPMQVVNRVSRVDVPVLVMHGTADSPAEGGSALTSVAMARRFEAALKKAGKRVEAVYYEGAEHNALFTSVSQYDDAVRRITSFLRPPADARQSSVQADSSSFARSDQTF